MILVGAGGCQPDSNTSRGVASPNVKNVHVEILNPEGARVVFGDTLRVKLSFDADTVVEEVSLVTQRIGLSLMQSDSLVFYMPTSSMGGGYHSLRAEVKMANGKSMRGSASLRVVLPEEPAEWGYRIIETYAHDETSYTQGLLFHDGFLFESTGRYGLSDIRKVNPKTGEVMTKQKLADEYFAEGLALFNDELFQLTWREKMIFAYDVDQFEATRSFGFEVGNGEGWGLAYTGEEFVFSDGSPDLYFLHPEDWTVQRQLRVFDHTGDVLRLNELEYVGGKIYANLLDSRKIAVIDPDTGEVLAYWNLEGLLESQPTKNRVDVMNGIAYNPLGSSFYVTGKLWPYLFEIQPVFN